MGSEGRPLLRHVCPRWISGADAASAGLGAFISSLLQRLKNSERRKQIILEGGGGGSQRVSSSARLGRFSFNVIRFGLDSAVFCCRIQACEVFKCQLGAVRPIRSDLELSAVLQEKGKAKLSSAQQLLNVSASFCPVGVRVRTENQNAFSFEYLLGLHKSSYGVTG